jgi:hypothetical protein
MSVTVARQIDLSQVIIESITDSSLLFNRSNVAGKTTATADLQRGGTTNRWRLKTRLGFSIPAGSTITSYTLTVRGQATVFSSINNPIGFCVDEASLFPSRNFQWIVTIPTTMSEITVDESISPTVGSVFASTWGSTLLGNTSAAWNSIGLLLDVQSPGATGAQTRISWLEAVVTYTPLVTTLPQVIMLGDQF